MLAITVLGIYSGPEDRCSHGRLASGGLLNLVGTRSTWGASHSFQRPVACAGQESCPALVNPVPEGPAGGKLAVAEAEARGQGSWGQLHQLSKPLPFWMRWAPGGLELQGQALAGLWGGQIPSANQVTEAQAGRRLCSLS